MSVSDVENVSISGEVLNPFSRDEKFESPGIVAYRQKIEADSLTQILRFYFVFGDSAGEGGTDTTLCGITVIGRGERKPMEKFIKQLVLELGPSFKSPAGSDLLYEDKVGNSVHVQAGDENNDGDIDLITVHCVAEECSN